MKMATNGSNIDNLRQKLHDNEQLQQRFNNNPCVAQAIQENIDNLRREIERLVNKQLDTTEAKHRMPPPSPPPTTF